MCESTVSLVAAAATAPVSATGLTVDSIRLEPVDEIRMTTLVDNVYGALHAGDDRIVRTPFAVGTAIAPQFENGRTTVGPMAEHGFSALVTVHRGETTLPRPYLNDFALGVHDFLPSVRDEIGNGSARPSAPWRRHQE
jgi:7,8-dihydropterin-6-yl-methyl-4-(beta-D-ribofuranosyl)aminobenzene 5'-phosphate synthase